MKQKFKFRALIFAGVLILGVVIYCVIGIALDPSDELISTAERYGQANAKYCSLPEEALSGEGLEAYIAEMRDELSGFYAEDADLSFLDEREAYLRESAAKGNAVNYERKTYKYQEPDIEIKEDYAAVQINVMKSTGLDNSWYANEYAIFVDRDGEWRLYAFSSDDGDYYLSYASDGNVDMTKEAF